MCRQTSFPLTGSEVERYANMVSDENYVDNSTAQIDTGAGIVELHEENGHFSSGSLILDIPEED